MKTRPPVTSRAAYHSQKAQNKISPMQEKVLNALNLIKWGPRDKIVKASGLEPAQVWRRLSELTEMKLIVKTDFAQRSDLTGELQAVYKIPGYKLKLTE